MSSTAVTAVRMGKSAVGLHAEQVFGGLFCPGPDPAELRAWVADDIELGKRVADDFLGAGRCLPGTLDLHFSEVQSRKFPDPDDAPKRRAGLGTACLCQDHSHYRRLGRSDDRVHCGPPAGTPLTGLFWTAHITYHPATDAKGADSAPRSRPATRRSRPRPGQTE
jgi:hypothetical protein